jgi:hypothetical protein
MKTVIIIIVVMTAFLLLSVVSCKKVRVTSELKSEQTNELLGKWKEIYFSATGFSSESSPKENQTIIWNFTSDTTLSVTDNMGVNSTARYFTLKDTLKCKINNSTYEDRFLFKIKSDSLRIKNLQLGNEGLFIKVK